MRYWILGILSVCALNIHASEAIKSDKPSATDSKEASQFTIEKNQALLKELPFSNEQDFKDAKNNFLSNTPDLEITNNKGQIIWSLKDYAFLSSKKSPETVNPSLWRQAQLNMNYGLYKVVDNIYQVRGYDLSNINIIEGKTGIIIVDPLTLLRHKKSVLFSVIWLKYILDSKNRGPKTYS